MQKLVNNMEITTKTWILFVISTKSIEVDIETWFLPWGVTIEGKHEFIHAGL